MKVEIWSDIMCPFCYIGKRNFESALAQFGDAEEVEVEWKSFQLDPATISGTGKNVYEYLAERKGISVEQSIQMHQQVTQTAQAAGLTYRFDSTVIANSYNAHRLIQLAKQNSLGDAAEERLFKAYFTDGQNIDDPSTLLKLGKEIGLEENSVQHLLESNAFSEAVDTDIEQAAQLGIRGVPFFVFDQKYAVSGAQPVNVFMHTLQKAVSEWKMENTIQGKETDKNSCSVDGECI